MGRIFLSRLIICLFIFTGCFSSVFAQENYYVFKTVGKPFFYKKVAIHRGEVFNKEDTLVLHKKDTVFLINQLGDLFELATPNLYTFSSLPKFKKIYERDSFTRKYFSYVWNQFLNKKTSRQQPGVVYRGERNIKLISPIDSVSLYIPEILFSWNNGTDNLTTYFHLQDLETKHITKIGLTSNSLLLYRDNIILKAGKQYKWAVTSNAFPDFSKVNFYNLKLLTKEEYVVMEAKMNSLIVALKLLGFSEEEVKEAICSDYKFCNF